MFARDSHYRLVTFGLGLTLPLLFVGVFLIGLPAVTASGVASVDGGALDSLASQDTRVEELAQAILPPAAPTAPCAGGPTIDGVLLDECYIENFNVGGDSVSIRVWYTNNPVTATRTVDGSTVVLSHWIDTDAQAQQVATFGRQAWERYFAIFGQHPYVTGCSNRINVQMEDGVGWAGIAYWASSGSCRIGIDSPMVRGGNTANIRWTVYHEFQHYQQYSFDSGCYANLKANYDNGSAAGNAEFTEGYADLAADAVNAGLDATGYGNTVSGYNPLTSMFDKSYMNVYNKYYIEQVGSMWTPADPWHHMDAVDAHYRECDVQDDLYVLDSVIPAETSGALTEERLFLNFFAANWAKDWANPVTQPELVYTDDDGNPYGQIALAQDVNLAGGSQSWTGENTPDDWAGKYYQVRPQAGCPYVTVTVDGAAGAHLGINLMAADTVGATSVSRSAWIGENFSRTFAGTGVHHRIVAAVNAFDNVASYDVTFSCVTPNLDILEPRQTNFALVGDPASPISFLARFTVMTGANTPVLGLPESAFSGIAEGDAVTIVPGSLQEVGEQYWAVMVPPVKPAGTSFVDLQLCLDGAICDTETNALLYADPGNTDFGLVFDGSGSMATEDVIGEGTRLVNAQKAGKVLADLLQVGDRVLVTSFSAIDNPPGCGLPSGDGNCPLDIQTHLGRSDVTGPGTITAAKNAIDLVTAREWTPIGAALTDAKDKLLAAPFSLNPKHIVLLSDGEENVNPLYDAVRAEIIASGVVVDTIGFSGDSSATLLTQIAAETGGTYRYVPTTGGTLAMPGADQLDRLAALGVPPALLDAVNTPFLPGPLALADVYDYYETKGQGATRVFHTNEVGVPNLTWEMWSTNVDASVNSLRMVVAGKQPDLNGACGDSREVEVLPPGAGQRAWIPISPPSTGNPPPANWDIRHSLYDDVLIVTNPAPGTWSIRTRYNFILCAARGGESQVPEGLAYDFMMNGSVQSDIRLQGRFLAPIMNNRGMAGDNVPIVATLMSRTGTISDAVMIGLVEKPGAGDLFVLFDDGMHSDGAAGDGIFGTFYSLTNVGGNYNVRLLAGFNDPAGSGDFLIREWMGAFWIDGPSLNDQDRDGLPDPWEVRCKLDTTRDDSAEDPDRDGLTNAQELQRGTLPCRPDTDRGGERDGSEVNNGRNPLWGQDDRVSPLRHFSVRPLNSMILINWSNPLTYTHMTLHLSTDPDQLGQPIDMGSTAPFTVTNVSNDQTYYVILAAGNRVDDAQGEYSDSVPVTPRADPDPPSGAFLINNGAPAAASKDVVLNISASDEILPGAAQSANAHLGGPLAAAYNQVSGGVEMRISNDPSFAGAAWEPLVAEKPWTLGWSASNVFRVFAQFRDSAGNESFIVTDDIVVNQLYLPVVRFTSP